MSSTEVLLLALLIGIFSGLRSLAPTAMVAWGAHLGWLKLHSPLRWLGSPPAVILFTLLALVELVADKLPNTPSRTAPPGLIARILLGALSGGTIYMAGAQELWLLGCGMGVLGALAGTYGGYQVRARLVKTLRSPDYVIAVLEDLVAICGSLWVVSRF
jgi:uncharacterized membrane protein